MRLSAIFCLFVATVIGLHAQSGCIYGKALDTNDKPIQDLTIHAGKSDKSYSLEVDADADGHFFLADLPLGEYQIFTSDEIRDQPGQLNLKTSDLAPAMHVELTADSPCLPITLRRAPRAHLRLRATDALTGERIGSVDGSFRISRTRLWRGSAADSEMLVPPLTRMELQFGARGYENSAIQQLSGLQPAETREISIALRPVQLGCVAGVVQDEQGAPVPRVRVQLSHLADHLRFDPAVKSTGQNGTFEFDGLQPGDYFVLAPEALDYSGLEQAVVTVAGGEGCSGTVLSLGHKAARLELVILDAITHEPVHDVGVWLAGSLNDGRNGIWSMKVIGDGTRVPSLQQFQLSAGAEGYETSKMTISPMQPEEIQKITIQLQPERKIQVTY